MDRPDSELLVRLGEGDLAAFDAIVQLYESRLIGYFQALSGDRQLAEDCAQEVFLKVYRSRATYTPDAPLATFVFRIARNHWIDVYRARKARPEPVSLDAPLDGDQGASLQGLVAGGAADPRQPLEAAEERERLALAIRRLPEIQQSVLLLACGQGLKYEQVGAILGIPVGTVKSRVHAAVQTLKRLFEAEEPRSS